MLDKPKFLTGEVKEFIDEFAKYWHNTKLDYKQISFYLFETSNFYNQPFDTAMIEKYFKGWVKTKDLSFIVMNGNNRILIGKKAIYEDQGRDVFADNYLFPKPRTLNHFISDCKRAGIDLEWSE